MVGVDFILAHLVIYGMVFLYVDFWNFKMSANNKELEAALDKIDMEFWLSREAVDYKVVRGRSGIQLNVKECPACGNSNWKVYLNQDSGLGNCFHGDCEAKFSKYNFIRHSLGNPTHKDTIEHIKAVAKEQGWRPAVARSMATNTDVSGLKFPESHPIPIKGRNLKYLDRRGISLQTAKHFGLRFCLKGHFESVNAEGRRETQRYDNRVIIPIFNIGGDLVSFQGRDIIGTAEKKYLFPPGFASTGSLIYNGHNAYGCVEACMGEGAFDVFAIHQAFVEDSTLCSVAAIGSFGKHLSSGDENSQLAKLIELKEAGLKRITLLWDGEKQALLDAIDTALKIKAVGIIARVGILPSGRDPNEVAPSVVRDAFWNAITIDAASAAKLKLSIGGKI